jgi:RimJ/RimL family protein N-acetyltransferase
MKLVSVYNAPFAVETLYQLLRARPQEDSISHRKMPTFEDHVRFVKSHPYRIWKLLEVDEIYVGSIYLTDQFEIGIHLFSQFKDKGYEAQAIAKMIQKYELEKVFMNVSPTNTEYADILKGLGFRLIQHTYEKTV